MTQTPAESVSFRTDGGIAWITLNRPARRNALDDRLLVDLTTALERAEADPAIRVIVIDAEGADFCAGADLEQTIGNVTTAGPIENLADAARLGRLFVTIRRLTKVVIAAVQGRALAGGAGLALVCDVVLASETAQFGFPEVQHGLVPAMVGAILRRLAGERVAFELLIRGEPIAAPVAEQRGLVTRVLPDGELQGGVERYARDLAALSAAALQLTKRLFYGQDGLSFEEGIGRGAEVNVLARSTPEARQGMQRFLDRRRRD